MKKLTVYLTFAILAAAYSVEGQHPLDSWVRRLLPGLNTNLNSVAFGNGVFVAVGDGSTMARSTDGVEWTVGSPGSFGNLKRVRFLAGEFVAVGTSDKILFSTDGATWVERSLPSANSWDAAFGNQVYVVAGAATYVSSNGVDWVTTVPRGGLPLDSLDFGNGRFVGLPGGSTLSQRRPSVYSTNGTIWETGTDAPTTQQAGTGEILFGDGLFLGTGSDISQVSGVMASSDGSTWCCRFTGSSVVGLHGAALAFGQGHFLWVQQSAIAGTQEWPWIYSSTNGSSWVTRFTSQVIIPPSDPGYEAFQLMKGRARGAAFGNGFFVVVGDQGYIAQSGNVGGAPIILQQPQDRGAVSGNPASFSVQVSGALPLSYQWYRGTNEILDATNVTYTISQVTPGDTGGYHVVVTNSFGSVTSRVAQLTVAFLGIKQYAGIEILGVPGRTYRIEATPANGPVDWQTLTNLVLPSSPHTWIDYQSPNVEARLYRAAELP